MKAMVKKVVVISAWAVVFSFVAVMIAGGLAGLWAGYHIKRGNNPVDNPELMKRASSLVATTPTIGALAGIALGLMGKLPGTRDTQNSKS